MDGLHKLAFSSSFVVLLLTVSASSPPPAASVQGAGEDRVWTVPPPPPRNGTGETPNRWAIRHRFHVFDVLDFKNWDGPVLVVRRRDYERCSSSNPLVLFADNNATTRIILGLPGRRGLFYFIAAAPPRCKAGEHMAVRVVVTRYPSSTISAAPAPAPAMAPTAGDVGPEQDAPDQSVPSDKPWKKVVYTVLGFLAGGLFTLIALFVCIRCCANQN